MKVQEQELLVHGMKEYPAALNAIEAFQELVQDTLRSVVETNLEEYAKALRIKKPELRDHEHHEDDGTHFVLGNKFKSRYGKAFVAEFYHCFIWSQDEETTDFEMQIEMSVTSSKKSNIDRLEEVLMRNSIAFKRESKWLWLEQKVTVEDAANLNDKLDTLIQEWIDLWRDIGGVKALTGDGTEEDEAEDQ